MRPVRALLGAAAGVAAVAAALGPSVAQAGTAVQFQVQAGTLTISEPAGTAQSPVDLGTVTIGSSSSAQLGTVTVSDQRGLGAASWTATVSSTDFSTGGGTPATIAKEHVSYWSGAATTAPVVGITFVPGQIDALAKQTLAATRTAFGATVVTPKSYSVSWNPTLVVTPPAEAAPGTYTGTITHSLA